MHLISRFLFRVYNSHLEEAFYILAVSVFGRFPMEFTAQEKYEFKRLLDGLRSKTGRGTELISLYIPPISRSVM